MNQESQQFDTSVLDSLHEAIGDGINHIISIYVDDVPSNIVAMRDALQKQEFETIGRIAHSLKSSSGNLGAVQLANLSIGLEQLIRNGSTEISVINAAIDEIEYCFKQIQPRLIAYVK
jgi:HPt (histidine-containing phosphotransfer) domain-containing protein